jgi:hypothetical protein
MGLSASTADLVALAQTFAGGRAEQERWGAGLVSRRNGHDAMSTRRIRSPLLDRLESVVGAREERQLQENRALFAAGQSELEPSAARIVDDAVHLESPGFARRVDHPASQLLEQLLARYAGADSRECSRNASAGNREYKVTEGSACKIVERYHTTHDSTGRKTYARRYGREITGIGPDFAKSASKKTPIVVFLCGRIYTFY